MIPVQLLTPCILFMILFRLTNHQFYDIISAVPQYRHPESTSTVAVHPLR